MAAMEVEDIDSLLERYLHLLDRYTSLRTELSNLQTGMYQDLARANFSAERGMRFGQDFYDDRMQASTTVRISMDDRGVPTFTPTKEGKERAVPSPETNTKGHETRAEKEIEGVEDGKKEENLVDRAGPVEEPEAGEQQETSKPSKPPRSRDPLQWFGLLTPMPLRQAQGRSIQLIEQVIPKLVSVNAEMNQVEIQVRRARKKRAKAAATVEKEKESLGSREISA